VIKTVDNFIAENCVFDNKKIEVSKNYYFEYEKNNDIKNNLNITLKDFKKNSNNIFISFKKDKNKDDDIIIFLNHQESNNKKFYNIQTGNYIGEFTWEKVKIDIQSRFNDIFLKRMLNFANNIYFDDVEAIGQLNNKIDCLKLIIYYMFIQNLEKAFLLGIPKSYTTIKHHQTKVRGRVDINRFIKNDIPFKGKISSVSREQREIQEIIDVLYKAIKIIETNKLDIIKNISYIKTHLKQNKSNKYVSKETINKAINSKALQNPIFAPYKTVLEYASYIIDENSIEKNKNSNKTTYGFLINIAELFEIYITKLLQREFPNWYITSPKIELYKDKFFGRKIIPDIVMQKENQILVFDTKYKKMEFRSAKNGVCDVDRADFFQIHSYISYYQNQKDLNVIAGGLIYPIEKKFDKSISHSNNFLGNDKTKFIVDGIELTNIETTENIIKKEKEFIDRIKELIQV